MKYFVFDIDGTLIDSSKVDQWAMRTALAEFGYHFTADFLLRYAGQTRIGEIRHSGRAGRADHGALGSTGV